MYFHQFQNNLFKLIKISLFIYFVLLNQNAFSKVEEAPKVLDSLINSQQLDDVKKTFNGFLGVNTADVVFDGKLLFQVTDTEDLTSQERSETANYKLEKILQNIVKNKLIPKIYTSRRHGLKTLNVNNDFIVSVTESDLAINPDFLTTDELATHWKKRLKNAFDTSLKERSEDFLVEALSKLTLLILITLLLSIIIRHFIMKFLKGNVTLILVGLWTLAFIKALGIFPETRPLNYSIESGILRPLFLLVIISWLMFMLNRASYILINWYFRHSLPEGWSATNRRLNRALTIKKVLEASSNFSFFVLGVITFLYSIGVNLTSLITGAGLIGIAVGFIAQDLIKDFLNGLAILLEDQFGVGDVIRIDKYSGKVEDFSLRMTKIRNMEGCLINIPNKKIDIVENLTSGFAQVDLQIGVDYHTDLQKAMDLMKETAEKLAEEWSDKIIQSPEMLGVDKLADSSIILRMTVRTLPMEQWVVMRELNLRVKTAFDEANIKIPYPQREVTVKKDFLEAGVD
jgi:small-conductance mechanosensitive channel